MRKVVPQPRRAWMGRTARGIGMLVACAGLALLVANGLRADAQNAGDAKPKRPRLIDAAKASARPASPTLHSVQIRPGPKTPQLRMRSGDTTVEVKCSTCHHRGAEAGADTSADGNGHSTYHGRAPDVTNRTTSDLKDFHQTLPFSHNDLSCLSCHNPNDYESLRMADGTSVAFPDVMKLCAQCHGNVYRDYLHGAHGGMTGYWDLSKGPRMRNNCVDCHHPHTPKFPKMRPVFGNTPSRSSGSTLSPSSKNSGEAHHE